MMRAAGHVDSSLNCSLGLMQLRQLLTFGMPSSPELEMGGWGNGSRPFSRGKDRRVACTVRAGDGRFAAKLPKSVQMLDGEMALKSGLICYEQVPTVEVRRAYN